MSEFLRHRALCYGIEEHSVFLLEFAQDSESIQKKADVVADILCGGVDLMSNAGCKLPDCLQLLRLGQLAFQLLALCIVLNYSFIIFN